MIFRSVPVNTLSSRLSANGHIRTLESSPAVAKRRSSRLKLNPLMASHDDEPCYAVRLFMLGSKYLMIPLLSIDAR